MQARRGMRSGHFQNNGTSDGWHQQTDGEMELLLQATQNFKAKTIVEHVDGKWWQLKSAHCKPYMHA